MAPPGIGAFRYPCWSLLRSALLNGVDEQIDIVVEQLEVVRYFLHAADRRRHHEYLRAGLPSDRHRRLQIEVRFDEHQLHVLPLHLVDEVEGVLGCWWNARTR